jgi:hypothetical protein
VFSFDLLHSDLASALRELKAKVDAETPVFGGLIPKMKTFRKDLENAKIPFRDALGRRAEFHALRHTFGTHLSLSGVAPRVAMEAMRHSDIKLSQLTTRHYTDASKLPRAGAFTALPSFSEGGYTPKYTDCSDAAGQDEAPTGKVPKCNDMHEIRVNKGESHVLAQSVTQGQNSEDGARCRFRTYFDTLCFVTHVVSVVTQPYARVTNDCKGEVCSRM